MADTPREKAGAREKWGRGDFIMSEVEAVEGQGGSSCRCISIPRRRHGNLAQRGVIVSVVFALFFGEAKRRSPAGANTAVETSWNAVLAAG